VAPGKAPAADNVALPSSLDWRSKSGFNYITAVRTQGNYPTCVAFSTIGALESQEKIFADQPSATPDYSELDLFYNGGGDFKRGWTISSAMRVLLNRGVTGESDAPYSFAPSFKLLTTTAKYKKITNYFSVTGRDAMKRAIMSGPIAAAMDIYQDFMYYSGGIYQTVKGRNLGGHSVLIVGWNDSDECWVVKNNWGESWGQKGFFMIKYGQCRIDDYTAYGLEVDGSAPVAQTTADTTGVQISAVPSGIETTIVTDNVIELKWSPAANAEGYYIYLNGKLSGRTFDASYRLCGLTQNTTYEIQLSSFNKTRVESRKSQVLAVVTKTAIPKLVSPSNIYLIAAYETELLVGWSAVEGVDGYNVYTDGSLEVKINGAVSCRLISLVSNRAYFIQVTSVKDGLESRRASAKIFKTLASPPPPVPSSLEVALEATSEIDIKWIPSTGATSYKIYLDDHFYGEETANSCAVKYLRPNSTYGISVSACKGNNESARSAVVSAKTLWVPIKPCVTRFRGTISPKTSVATISYDLIDEDSSTVSVKLKYSIDDGVNYIDAVSITGDLGDIAPGRNKKITWNLKNDVVSSEKIRFKMVLADDYYNLDAVKGYVYLY